MDKREWELREQLCEIGRRLFYAGFIPGSDGNFSAILNEEQILITPSRLPKGFLVPSQIIKLDRRGRKLEGDLPPSLETAMHLAAYEERPDICAVAHCHPPHLIAFTVARQSLPSMILAELEIMFPDGIPMAPYATPGTNDLADSIRELIRTSDVVLLDHHGALSVGRDILQASMKIEHAEAAAKIIFLARQLGGEYPLPPESVEGLRVIQQRLAATEKKVFIKSECRVPLEPPPNGGIPASESLEGGTKRSLSEAEIDDLVNKITMQIKAGRQLL